MNISILGAHHGESRDAKFICLLIDDFLAIDAGGLTSSLSLPTQEKIKAILLTHQHYDHIRDIPSIAENLWEYKATVEVYSTQAVYDSITSHLLNGELYPKFHETPETRPTLGFKIIEPHQSWHIAGYGILAVPANHGDATVGYQVTSPDGKIVFYTADTGAGLAPCWERVLPGLLITEATFPNSHEEWADKWGHLTPALLGQELASFRKLKGYIPKVIVVHMMPQFEKEIAAEVAVVAENLSASITLAYEGMQIQV